MVRAEGVWKGQREVGMLRSEHQRPQFVALLGITSEVPSTPFNPPSRARLVNAPVRPGDGEG